MNENERGALIDAYYTQVLTKKPEDIGSLDIVLFCEKVRQRLLNVMPVDAVIPDLNGENADFQRSLYEGLAPFIRTHSGIILQKILGFVNAIVDSELLVDFVWAEIESRESAVEGLIADMRMVLIPLLESTSVSTEQLRLVEAVISRLKGDSNNFYFFFLDMIPIMEDDLDSMIELIAKYPNLLEFLLFCYEYLDIEIIEIAWKQLPYNEEFLKLLEEIDLQSGVKLLKFWLEKDLFKA